MVIFSQLIELDKLAKVDGGAYKKRRFAYQSLKTDSEKHFTGIVGARGIGKTIILKQLASEKENSFYISLDTIEEELFDIIYRLNREFNKKYFLLDEVHTYRNFDKDLKKIYDFLDVKVIFTSSVALAMFESVYDLSRRIRLFTLYPFSFREYLFFKYGVMLDRLSAEDFYNKNWSIDYFEHSSKFLEYLQGGIMPFSLEEPDPLSILNNILKKIMNSDIPSISRLRIDEVPYIYKLLTFIGRSSVDGINYSSISSNIGITKYKAEQYVELLERSFILQRLFPAGTNVLKEPKILMNLPYRLLYSDFSSAIGGLREDYVVEMLRANGVNPSYLKSTRGSKTPDFIIPFAGKEVIVEVGGKGKGREQFKGIAKTEKMILTASDKTDGIKYPLFMLGFVEEI